MPRMKYFFRFLFFAPLLLLTHCAKIVSPVGGPRDVTPPVIIKEVPSNESTFFNSNTIKLSFDEFVTLDNTLENVLISPPLQQQPIYSISGKTLTIKILDTLLTNQTYNIGFADCIKDFTEGNPIPFYNYSFSTGSYVDSFMLKGTVIDAATLKKISNCFVFAYSEDIDSLPLTTCPKYISKTQKDGTFSIKNIQSGNYKLFALKDINNNLIFDLPNEEIAFLLSCQKAVPIPQLNDSLIVDSNHFQLETDTLSSRTDSTTIELRLFLEEDTTQNFVKLANSEMGKYEFIYKNKINRFNVQLLSDDSITYFQKMGRDTVTWYMKRPVKDSVDLLVTVNDTVRDTLFLTPFKKKETVRARQRNDNEDKSATLAVSATNLGELYVPPMLHFAYPILSVDSFEVQVIKQKKHSGNDTSYLRLSIPDTFLMQTIIPIVVEEKVPYIITIKDSVFQGYNGKYNDTVQLKFTGKSEKVYGDLRMMYRIKNPDYQYIVQLSNAKSEIVSTHIIRQSETVEYPKLPEGNYQIKVIEDRNGNGKWDTGNYRKKILPEPIFFYEKNITIRGYWELEEVFDF